jgi:hypothetical protein
MNVLSLLPIPLQTHADAPARARLRKTEPPGKARDEKDEKKKATDHALSLSAARMGWDKFFWGYRHYDLAGRAEGRTPPTTASTTHYVYDGDRLVGEYSGSGALLRRYAHGVGVDEPLVWYEGAGLTDRRFMHADHQGSIIATSTGAGRRDGVFLRCVRRAENQRLDRRALPLYRPDRTARGAALPLQSPRLRSAPESLPANRPARTSRRFGGGGLCALRRDNVHLRGRLRPERSARYDGPRAKAPVERSRAVAGDVVTASFSINFLAAAKGERLRARGAVVKAGRRIVAVEARVYAETDADAKLVAIALVAVSPVSGAG